MNNERLTHTVSNPKYRLLHLIFVSIKKLTFNISLNISRNNI